MMETPEQNRNVFAVKKFLSEYLDLRKDKDNELETVDSIRKGVEFKGANLWILIFAIFMASLGLNVNSTAVIIGAMLISPLMGPIMGVGLSVGLNDFELMKRSLKLSDNDSVQCNHGYCLLSCKPCCRRTVGASGTYFTYDL